MSGNCIAVEDVHLLLSQVVIIPEPVGRAPPAQGQNAQDIPGLAQDAGVWNGPEGCTQGLAKVKGFELGLPGEA